MFFLLGELKEILLALMTGLIVGVLFAKFKLPIPAPPTLSGVVGIIGIFLGYWIVKNLAA